ncbi:MAG: SDR family oxidoreductase [Zetaproteobacteria bacterium]|nr:MAG: SDR family oxidoreductase [Zetaproteobacteria bacterium]
MATRLFDISGKIALVTGAAQGLGLAMATGLARAGAQVVLNDIQEAKLRVEVGRLDEAGFCVHACPFDVRDSFLAGESVAGIERDVGPIHLLVNNAGIHRRGPIDELPEAAWREVVDTNLTAAFLLAKRVVPGMIARRSGKIVNICSVMSEVGRPTVSAYMASKGGLKMLTKAMAVEWAKHNIQVNGIAPGWMATEMNRPLMESPALDAWVRSRVPAGRYGDPTEMVGALIYLSSSASDFVTGQIVYLDGGTLAAL